MSKSRAERKIMRKLLMENIHKADFGDEEAEKLVENIGKKMVGDRERRSKRWRVVVIYPNGYRKEFANGSCAARYIGVSKSTIYKHIDGKTMDTHGHRYEEIKEVVE